MCLKRYNPCSNVYLFVYAYEQRPQFSPVALTARLVASRTDMHGCDSRSHRRSTQKDEASKNFTDLVLHTQPLSKRKPSVRWSRGTCKHDCNDYKFENLKMVSRWPKGFNARQIRFEILTGREK